jgi:RNA polymerase sigma-70 factor (ECF subfamily)
MSKAEPNRNELYQEAAAAYGLALERLARAYEADRDRQQDLLQEIHIAIWKSFGVYESRCAIRTWVYRVAHNTAAKYVGRQRRAGGDALITLEEMCALSGDREQGSAGRRHLVLEQLMELIHRLKPPDRQLMLLYLEGIETASIGEIIGLSPANVRTKIHRLKAILSRQFHTGEEPHERSVAQ